MKKQIILLSLIISMLFMTSCAGLGDWRYSLPNGYEVWHINSEEIIVKYCGDENINTKIPSLVKEFAFDTRYVYSLNVPKKGETEEYYYILDTLEHRLYGPFESSLDFEHAVQSLGVSIPNDWLETSSDPNLPG